MPYKTKRRVHRRRVPDDTPVSSLSWQQRILDLRHTLGWNGRKFARISRMDRSLVMNIENGNVYHVRLDPSLPVKPYFPSLSTIRKIRFLESAFDEELRAYRCNPALYNRLPLPVYDRVLLPFDGVRYRYVLSHRTRPRLRPIQRPRRPEDFAKMGGVAAFRRPRSNTPAKFTEADKARWDKARSDRARPSGDYEFVFRRYQNIRKDSHRILHRRMDELLRMFASRDTYTTSERRGQDAGDRAQPAGRSAA